MNVRTRLAVSRKTHKTASYLSWASEDATPQVHTLQTHHHNLVNMTAHYFRTTALGTIVRLATNNRFLALKSYKDEYPKEASSGSSLSNLQLGDDCILVGW